MSWQEAYSPDDDGMSYQMKSSIVTLGTTMLVFMVYAVFIFQRYQSTPPAADEVLRFWGTAILLMVAVMVVAQIISQVTLNVVNAIITQEEEPDLVDELDKVIELKSTRNFYHTFMIGFMLAMGALVIEQPLTTMFIILFIALIVAGIMGDVSRLYYYRRGV